MTIHWYPYYFIWQAIFSISKPTHYQLFFVFLVLLCHFFSWTLYCYLIYFRFVCMILTLDLDRWLQMVSLSNFYWSVSWLRLFAHCRYFWSGLSQWYLCWLLVSFYELENLCSRFSNHGWLMVNISSPHFSTEAPSLHIQSFCLLFFYYA